LNIDLFFLNLLKFGVTSNEFISEIPKVESQLSFLIVTTTRKKFIKSQLLKTRVKV